MTRNTEINYKLLPCALNTYSHHTSSSYDLVLGLLLSAKIRFLRSLIEFVISCPTELIFPCNVLK